MSKKETKNKLPWSLMPWNQLEEVMKVIEMGARKYSPNDWKGNVDKRDCYIDALHRHVVEYSKGEPIDEESGLQHLAHVAVNCLFLMYFDEEKETNVSHGSK